LRVRVSAKKLCIKRIIDNGSTILKFSRPQDGVTIFIGTRGPEYDTVDEAVDACGGASKIALGVTDISSLTSHKGATEAVGMDVLFPMLTAQAVHNFAAQIRTRQDRPQRKHRLPTELVAYVLSRMHHDARVGVADFPEAELAQNTRRRRREARGEQVNEEEEEEEEEGLFKVDAVTEEDPERDRATQEDPEGKGVVGEAVVGGEGGGAQTSPYVRGPYERKRWEVVSVNQTQKSDGSGAIRLRLRRKRPKVL